MGKERIIGTARFVTIVSWLLQIILAVIFAGSGVANLIGVAKLVALFDQIGAGQWLRYASAIVALLGAIAVIIPGTAAFGAVWLGTMMLAGLGIHLFILHSGFEPPLILLCLTMLLGWLRRDELVRLLWRLRF